MCKYCIQERRYKCFKERPADLVRQRKLREKNVEEVVEEVVEVEMVKVIPYLLPEEVDLFLWCMEC